MSFVSVTQLDRDCHVVHVDYYAHKSYDHGVVWAILEDSHGNRSTVCIDGRKDSKTCNRLFDQARHPSKPGAVLVELGSEIESTVAPLLSNWIDSERPSPTGKITDEGLDIARNILLRLGEPP